MASLDNQMALAPKTLLDIYERRRTTISFIELPMLYPVNSTIYTWENSHLRAFLISDLSGMDRISAGSLIKFDPLVLHVWGVDHDGMSFVKRHRALEIKQFFGEVKIDRLQYTPAGYLPDEHVYRRRLVCRGRRYWELGDGTHHLQYQREGTVQRVIVDMGQRDVLSANPDDVDIRLPPLHHNNLKPLMAVTCNPKVLAYLLSDNKYREVDVTGLHATVFQEDPLCDLILSSTNRVALESALSIFRHPPHSTVHRSAPGPTIVLLHGGPGVGKTTTARSSAEHLRLPLLEVSTGDIERQGKGSQEAFHQLLANANRWGAVLSLEDAHMLFPDHKVDFEERHYSALLMIEALEAHSGLLFLVTDRIGIFFECPTHSSQYCDPTAQIRWRVSVEAFS
ncbi:hypothetical protein B0T11DRAFT_119905 [Plectosphaerella cucumerina]|uniref:AAA+ ATPase domain-containing protein n=1 Tax=Plectosphaerella cucumerina TaxID=40658 RepID=A0A8K0T896_9PEZI|nr:hypothetical protein B0T11DRAFT_119905 [Plectosphaerella cucumerina]